MNTDGSSKLNGTTARVIGAAQRVSRDLGCGFLEKVYENALRVELETLGLRVQQQRAVDVRYRDHVVGQYFADLVVEEAVVVELKAAHCLDKVHWAQCLNYLRATGLRVCLLLNFGTPRLDVRRIIHDP